jgi:type IV pilus assembly protein PilX
MRRAPPAGPKRSQAGIALIISLVLLVVMLVLGLSAVRLLSSEERMTGYAYDRSLSFQAAEAALREAEALVEQVKPTPANGACTDFTAGMYSVRACPSPAAADTPRWLDNGFGGWARASVVGTSTTAITPRYFVEYLGGNFPCGPNPTDTPACKRYRITVQAGGAGRGQTMLQSVYATN